MIIHIESKQKEIELKCLRASLYDKSMSRNRSPAFTEIPENWMGDGKGFELSAMLWFVSHVVALCGVRPYFFRK